MIIGTAGHIDHGKTTLIRALSGVATDRLKDERKRGITIELGYAYMPLDNGDVLGFVDVPGHEKLVRMMVAGAGGIDFALLVVAADDGIMPQTREHLAILRMLGISRAAVALTRMDRVNECQLESVRHELADWLAATPFAKAPIFAVNATQAEDPGTQALRSLLLETAVAMPARRDTDLFRLAVDRVFTLSGQGTIATGTVFAGRVQVGDRLQVMPGGRPVRVRSIHAQDRAADSGHAGQRCALNLVGIDHDEMTRGQWLADPRVFAPGRRLDVELHYPTGAPLTNGSTLHIHLGTDHQVARMLLMAGDQLTPGNSTRAQLVFERPICAVPGDCFIMRDAQAAHTIGGGRVLDPNGPARRRRSPARQAWLDAMTAMLAGEGIMPMLEQAPQGLSRETLVRLCSRPPPHIDWPTEIRALGQGSEQTLMAKRHWQAQREQAIAALHQYHDSQPDEPGLEAGRLRRITAPKLAASAWKALVDELLQDQWMRRDGPWLKSPNHVITLSEAEQTLAKQVEQLLWAAGIRPLWVRDLAAELDCSEEAVREVMRKRTAQGSVHRVVRDLFLHPAGIRALGLVLQQLNQRDGCVKTAAYRDVVGLGRKRTIQILEYFDRLGYTRRAGNTRWLRRDADWADISGHAEVHEPL